MKDKKMSIDEAAVEAERLGMSYGKFVAYRDGLMKVENISQNKRAADNRPERGKDGRKK